MMRLTLPPCRPGETVSQTMARFADALGMTAFDLLASKTTDVIALAADCARVERGALDRREVPAERAAQSRRLLDAIRRIPTC